LSVTCDMSVVFLGTFLILFQKLCNAVRNGDVDLVQDCLHKGADLHYEDDNVSSIYTMVCTYTVTLFMFSQ
jgi:hypothetical protein